MSNKPIHHKLNQVLWREYDFNNRVVRIENPVDLYAGETTHRVVDKDGVVWIVPAPGTNGCIIRYKKADGVPPVEF